MSRGNYTIWLEAEQWQFGWDIHDANTDVIVQFDNGERWAATFFTYSNINTLVKKNKETGECLNGKFFWSSDMILVDEVSRDRIQEVIDHLLDNGPEDLLENIFVRCPDNCF